IATEEQLAFEAQNFCRFKHLSAAPDMREGLVEDGERLIVAAQPLIAMRQQRQGKLLSRHSTEGGKARDSLLHFGDPFFDFTELGPGPAPVKYSPYPPLRKSVVFRQRDRGLGVGAHDLRLPPIFMEPP